MKAISRRTFLRASVAMTAGFALGGCAQPVATPTALTTSATATPKGLSTQLKITNGEWAPFMSEGLPHYGFGSRIVTESLALEGLEVEYGFFPWARGLEYAKAGQEWVATIGWSRSEERDKYFFASDVLFIARNLFFYLKEQSFDWQTYDDLKGMTIGANIGYNYGSEFDKAYQANLFKVVSVETEEQLLKMLLAKRLDVVMVSEFVGYYLLKTKFKPEESEQVVAHAKSTRDSEKHLLISRQNPAGEQLLQTFNQGLAKLKANGQYGQYLSNALKGEY